MVFTRIIYNLCVSCYNLHESSASWNPRRQKYAEKSSPLRRRAAAQKTRTRRRITVGTISPFEYDFRYVLHNDKGFHAYHSVTMGHSMPRLHVHPYHELLIRRGCTPTTYISPSFSATVDFPAVVFQRAVTLHAANADASMEYDRTVCYFTDEYVASFADAADIFSRDKFDADCIIFPLPEALQDEFFQIDEKLTDKTLSPVRRRRLFALLLNMVSATLPPLPREAALKQLP